MKNILLILSTFIIFSCSKDSANLKSDKNKILDNGKCLEINDTEYKICLNSINDSRCPSGSECIWEGDALVEFNLKSDTENKPFTLHTNDNFQQDTIINNIEIKLLNLSPYPESNNLPNQSDYSAELNIYEQ